MHLRPSFATMATLLALVLPALVHAQQPSSVPNPDPGPPSDWQVASTSCIGETSPDRALMGYATASDDMTIAKCIALCDARDFVLAGLQVGLRVNSILKPRHRGEFRIRHRVG